jgi:hypothetical protein
VPVYIHEPIDIEGGARGPMIELIRTRFAPHLECRSLPVRYDPLAARR